MKTIALIACSGSKNPLKKKAQELYTGKTFVLARDKGVKKFHCDDFYIISAKHHLIEKDDEIALYNVQLKQNGAIDHDNNDEKIESNSQWANKVLEQLKEKGLDLKKDKFVIFGGRNYYKNLVKHLNCCFYRFKRGQYSLKEENLDFNDMGWERIIKWRQVMKFEHSKPVCEIRSSKDGIGKDVGIYCWWFKDDCVEALLKRISKDVDWKRLVGESLQHKVIDNVKYTALYVGIAAGKDGIFGRFKWHIEQKHTVSNVTEGYLSTLRRTLSALLNFKLLKNNTEVNS